MADAGQAWREHANELADVASLVFASNYSDWIGYLPLPQRKDDNLAVPRSGSLNRSILARHFRGDGVGDLVAMPYRSTPSRMGIPIQLWIGFDLMPGVNGIPDAAGSWRAVARLERQLLLCNVMPLVEEYDNSGNYHVWVLPKLGLLGDWENGPYPSAAIDWAEAVLGKADLPGECLAETLPLPGRHHSEDHWSRFWSRETWAEGKAAVRLLLNWNPIPVIEFREIVQGGRLAPPAALAHAKRVQ